jgi:hypothetical protein
MFIQYKLARNSIDFYSLIYERIQVDIFHKLFQSKALKAMILI